MEFTDGYSNLSYLNITKQICNSLYETANKNGNSKLNFYYDSDNTFNAYTRTKGADDYMCINVGTILDAFAHIKSAFSSSSFLLNFGNPNVEKNKQVLGKFDITKRQLLFTGDPIDPIRQSLSSYTALMMIRYIYSHELGHILNGHTSYVSTLYAVPKLEMVCKKLFSNFSENLRAQYALDCRTLEMDADSFAASMSIDNIMMLYIKRNENLDFFNLLNDDCDIFTLWSFAIHSIFLLLEYHTTSTYDPLSCYLPNEAREILSISSALNALNDYIKHDIFGCDAILHQKIISKIFAGIDEAEKFFNSTYYTNYHFIQNTNNNPLYSKFANEVLTHWNDTLYSKMEKYARIPLYHPDTIESTMEIIKNS